MSETTVFIPPHELNTAVLFLVFNRLDTTKQVFEAIRQAKPPRLYVAADGARANKKGEADKTQAVRDYIMQNIDWKCEVETLFREENLGCKYAVSGAITWFFENEEQGIILEDDCLPSQSFFWFCENLLHKYKDNPQIWAIGGTNLLSGMGVNDYLYSLHGTVWGWASWANIWKNYDIDIDVSYKKLSHYPASMSESSNLKNILCTIKQLSYSSWDYQWLIARIRCNGLTALPGVNLIKNIGFGGGDSTHTVHFDERLVKDNKEMQFPLSGGQVARDIAYDKALWRYKNSLMKIFIINTKYILKLIVGKKC